MHAHNLGILTLKCREVFIVSVTQHILFLVAFTLRVFSHIIILESHFPLFEMLSNECLYVVSVTGIGLVKKSVCFFP